jgi:hypothetical protein
METLLLTVLFTLLAVAGLSVGVLAGKKRSLKGSCHNARLGRENPETELAGGCGDACVCSGESSPRES